MRARATDRFEAEIRDLAAMGCSDPEIALAIGVSESAIWLARRRFGLAPRPRGGRYKPVLARGGEPNGSPTPVERETKRGAIKPGADEKFARAMAGRLFESVRLKPARRLALPRPDPAEGLGVSSAWSAMEMGERYRE